MSSSEDSDRAKSCDLAEISEKGAESTLSFVVSSSKNSGGNVKCTICSKIINIFIGNELQSHPDLEVPICKRCHKYLIDGGPWTQDENGKDEFCRWCGEGGNIIECDFCPKGFCMSCIRRNIGRSYFSDLKSKIDNDNDFKFQCFCCDFTKIENLRQRMANLKLLIEETRRSKKKSGEKIKRRSINQPIKSEIQFLIDDLCRKIENLKNLAVIDDLSIMELNLRDENLKFSTILDFLQKSVSSFNTVLEKSRDLALKEEDDGDFRSSQIMTKKSRKKSSYFYAHEAIKQFTDGFLIASVLMEKSQILEQKSSFEEEKSQKKLFVNENEKIQPESPLSSQTILFTPLTMDKSAKSDSEKMDREKDSETSIESVQEEPKSIFGAKSDSETSSKSVENEEEKSEKSSIEKERKGKSILAKQIDSEKSVSSDQEEIKSDSEKLIHSDQEKQKSNSIDKTGDQKSKDSEISSKSVQNEEEKSKKSWIKKERRGKSILAKKIDSEESVSSVQEEIKSDSEKSIDSDQKKLKSKSIDKIGDQKSKVFETPWKSDQEKSIDGKLKPEKSSDIDSKNQHGEFNDILSKFDQDFRSVGQLVLKVDKLRFGNGRDLIFNEKTTKKRSKIGKKRGKNDENSIKDEEITILDEKLSKSNSAQESEIEDENILMEYSNFGSQPEEEDTILASTLQEETTDQTNSAAEESSSQDQEKLTKLQKRRRQDEIEESSEKDQDQSISTTNQFLADKQLKKLLKLRVNMNANDLILEEKDENVVDEDEKGTKKKRKNAVKILSSGEEDDEDLQNSNFEDDEIQKQNSSQNSSDDDDEDFKSPKKKLKIKNNRKRKNLVESNSEMEENDDGSDYDSDSGKKKKNSKIKPKSKGRKRRIAVSTDEEDDDENEDLDGDSQNKKGRKEIRKIKKASSLQTDAYEEERERRRRIAEKQNMYNKIDHELIDIDTVINRAADSSQIADNLLILDQNLDDKDEIHVQVHPKISRFLKPHQLEGVRFLYNCTIESVKKSKNAGSGSILAHCMGLGKTFQVVAFLHTILTNERLNLKTAIVLAPVNVVLNWQHEFKHWLNDLDDELDLNVWELATVKSVEDRSKTVQTWQDRGGILILGYTLFVQLADDSKKDKRNKEKFRKIFKSGLLDPGPDFIVCDEGHMLKNEKTALSRVLSKIRTKRRICLTGTPLQNNLKEYYTMIQFVKPNLLGSKQEFANRFENPIKNGQYSDSTPHDVRIMKRRAHILHEMLAGCVQRQDYTALSKALPPKNEYVLSISLSEDQIALYNKYLMDVVQNLDAESLKARRSLFQDFMNLQRVWTHPYALLLHTEKMERLERIREENDFVDEGSSASASEESIFSVHDDDDEPPKLKKNKKDGDGAPLENEVIKTWQTRSRSGTKLKELDENPVLPALIDSAPQWYGDMVSEDCKTRVELSGKCFLLFEILKKCESIGDKLLVFSQSLVALDIIESFLQFFQEKGWAGKKTSASNDNDSLAALYKWRWARDKDYFRLDGSTPAEKRKDMSKIFNDPKNLRARLFLISTKAGSLGMNLFGANRVVVFDTNWNPTHDTQSIFRVYRFGQTKPVYIYRFIAHGTMEATIYERGVTKQSLACRVIDEQQIDRHFMGSDLEALYDFKPHEKRNEKLNSVAVPKDRLLADLLFEHKKWIITYHEHDSLLQNMEEEKLSKEEMQAAWDEYELERKNLNRYTTTAGSANYANLVANMDQFSIFCNAMPLLRVLIDEGETLVRMSREPVQYTLESIVRSWIEKDPEVKRNPPTILQKLEQLVSKLRIMVNAKMGQP